VTVEIREDLSPLRRRSAVLMVLLFVALTALLLRLAELQLLQAGEWRQRAENNRLRRVPVASRRGRIYDRRGRVLADDLPTWELLLFPDEAEDLDDTVLFLARTGVADSATLREQLADRRIGRLAPLVAAENLTWQQVARVRSHQSDHPELAVVSGFRRQYPFAGLTAHAVGHLRRFTREEVSADPSLDPNALVGATGIEALRDSFLSGEDGDRYVVVSAVGRQLGVVRQRSATAGRDLGTTIDADLQRVAAEAVGSLAGAVVALEPHSGAVRVLYSSPSFDPNVFGARLSPELWQQLSEDQRHPLQNRTIQGVYPPGSTIKPFFALAGLSDDVISDQWSVTCRGVVMLHGHPFRCWRRQGHGRVAVVRSLEVSCDTFYYLLGQQLGIDGMADWMRRFGFEHASGIGLTSEASGLIGTPEWSQRVRGTPWYPGEAVSVSIGQGPVLVTALQLARGYAALANGGRLVTPHAVKPNPEPAASDLGLDPEKLARVVEGLRLAVHGDEGTARSLRRLPVAGKTGTAQVARLQEGVDVEDLPPELRHHAWFVGWAPIDRPQLVVAVIIEHGGGGGSVAAPVAGAVLASALKSEASRS
jgi:penicillin-binding protein 2